MSLLDFLFCERTVQIQIFCPFFYSIFNLVLTDLMSSSYVLNTSALVVICVAKKSLALWLVFSCALCCALWTDLNYNAVKFTILFLWLVISCFKKSVPALRSWKYFLFPILFSKIFMVLPFTGLSPPVSDVCVWCWVGLCLFVFNLDIQLSQWTTHWKVCSFPIDF